MTAYALTRRRQRGEWALGQAAAVISGHVTQSPHAQASIAYGIWRSLGYRSPNIAPYRRVLVAMVHPAMWGASTVTVPAVRVAALAASVTRA